MSVETFISSKTELVVHGENCVAQGLVNVLADYNIKRVFLVTTPSVVRLGIFDQVKAALGDLCVGSFTQAVAHTPERVIRETVAAAQDAGVDGFISLGGSSVVDLVKSTIATLAEGDDYAAMRISFSPETGLNLPPLPAPKLPHFAIPTTLSASEFTMLAVITDEAKGEKNMIADFKLTPKVVFMDPTLTTGTPDRLWTSSGAKILCDCIEMLCSPRANAVNDAIAIKGVEILTRHLKASRDPENLDARAQCQQVPYMALGFVANAGLGMVSALRHQLGANQGLTHGVASAIMLPHALRWNRDVILDPLGRIAAVMGISAPTPEATADAVIDQIATLIADLGLPTRLSEVGVSSQALGVIAQYASYDVGMAANPRTTSAAELETVLQAAL